MTTGEGPTGGPRNEERPPQRFERISVGGGDDAVTRMQLAARWAEAYGTGPDSLGNILKRFRAVYEYLDAVTHGVEPAELDRDLVGARVVVPPPAAPTSPPRPAAPAPTYPPSAEPRSE